ncbi:FSA-C domain-containing protein [Aphelenchoides bicaudatus]|nr:FSA-C domain-containing protein [Aphelenchoides bicaudatus]
MFGDELAVSRRLIKMTTILTENTTDSSILDNIDLLKKVGSDIRAEWEGDEPDANFFLLLGALLLFVFWGVFAVYFFSRIVGLIVGTLLKRLLPFMLGNEQKLEHFSIGSFSVSLLAGKIMFRNVLYVTGDYVIKINDGWIIFSYWRFVPKKSEASLEKTRGLQTSRLHISFNGLKIHVFNRLDLYHTIARTRQDITASNFVTSTTKTAETTAGRLFNLFTRVAKKVDEKKLQDWWESFWRLVGTVVLDISTCRLIAGNQQLPYAFAVTFENFSSKINIASASNPEDLYMFRLKANMENTRISLVKQSGYATNRKTREEPPRTMNANEFAILQSANIQFFYHQDICGLVTEDAEQQSKNINLPVWETIWRLHKNTIISYGPWADKQRALLYSFFFPSDYNTVQVTQMPRVGERRIYIQHTTQVFFTNDASIDVWFMRNEELNAIHTRINHGSSLECTVPWICHENGYQSVFEGSFLFLEATTSLPFREFINCESAHFNLTVNFPRVQNAHQMWNFNLQLHRISTYIVWDHKRFLTDLIDEWSADDYSDLCKFVPYTWVFHVNIVDQFEVLLLLNDKNWVNTSTSGAAENTQAAIVGNQLLISFALPFVDFAPDLTKVDYEIKAFNQLSLRVCVPPQSPMEPIFKALHATSNRKHFMKPSTAFISTGPDQGFVEVWRTETIIIKLSHKFHPIASQVYSDIPQESLNKWLPRPASSPALLEPDDLYVNLMIGESEIEVSGLIARIIFDLKDNYFGSFDQITDVGLPVNGSITLKMTPEKVLTPEHFRPMNVKLEMKLQNIRAHCLTFGSTTNSQASDYCPIVFNEQVSIELSKVHSEALVQVQLAPTAVYFMPQNKGSTFMSTRLDPSSTQTKIQPPGWLTLSSLQFRGNGLYSDMDVPWKVEILEYAWLVEILVGDIAGNIQPEHLFVVGQFIESFLLLGLSPDESCLLPEKYNICHHFENIRTCSKSVLRTWDPTGNPSRCLSSETLKYKLVRVAVDDVNLLVHSNDYGLQLKTEDIRFSFCNAHNFSFSENLILKVPSIELNQFLYLSEKGSYLQCGQLKVDKVDLDVRLPYGHEIVYMSDERKSFLRKHDKPNQFLHFLWRKDKSSQHCGCFGSNHFFGDEDTTGLSFFDKDLKVAVFKLNNTTGSQPGYSQSIIHTNKSGICLEDVPESPHKAAKRDVRSEESDTLKRQLSDSSYKSANSKHSGDLVALLENYAEYLGQFEIDQKDATRPEFWHIGSIQDWISQNVLKISKLTDGISGLKLSLKASNQKRRSPSSVPNMDTNEEKFAASYAKDSTALYVRGQVADSVESPILYLPHTRHLLLQRIYMGCTLNHHSQPLNATPSASAAKNENYLLKNSIYICVGLPQINVAVFQSEPAIVYGSASKQLTFTTSAVLVHIENSQLNAATEQPPTFFQSTRSCSNVTDKNTDASLRVPDTPVVRSISQIPSKLQTTCTFQSVHIQFAHLVDRNLYDQNVYSKIPINCNNNWTSLPGRVDSQLRILCEAAIKDIDVQFALGNNGFGSPVITNEIERRMLNKRLEPNERMSTEASSQSHSLEIELTSIQLTSVLGKTTDATTNDTSNDELSIYEVLSPALNIWIQILSKFSNQLKQNVAVVEEWNDLIFLKLLADGLDFDCGNDQVFLNLTSCSKVLAFMPKSSNLVPSCKLILSLMRYVSKNSALLHQDFWTQILHAVDDFPDQKVRKQSVIALLSHWQTIICSQVQLFDNHVAQKYKCVNAPDPMLQKEQTPEAEGSSKTALEKAATSIQVDKHLPLDSNQLLNNPDAFDAHNSVKMTPVGRVEEQHLSDRMRQNQQQKLKHSASTPKFPSSDESTSKPANKRVSGHKRQSSTASATTFQPGHRRGPSTLTQATMTTDTQPKEDLYHWILRAQKEHKQRHVRTLEPQEAPHEVNPMELILSVFFHSIYEKRELDYSPIDTISLPSFNINFSLLLSDLKFDIIERKLLKSQSNQTFVSVNCHHLLALESFEIKGCQLYSFELDSNKLKPIRAEFFTNYTAKIQSIRLIASLASICFVNDVGVSIQTCCAAIPKEEKRQSKMLRQRLNTSLSEPVEDWATNVIDKLLNYQRFASRTTQRNSQLIINTVGSVAIKTVLLESIISDLFISTTMIRIELSHAHQRIFNSRKPFSPTSTSIIKSKTIPAEGKHSNDGKPMDLVNLEVKRANLIFSEHRANNQRKPSEIKQICNCSLRQSFFKFETFGELSETHLSPITNNLLIDLGEIEFDLPMHAQSIHEVALRHGPQLNEQLHQIISKHDCRFPINYALFQSPYSTDARQSSEHHLDALTIDVSHLRDGSSKEANETGEESTLIEPPIIQSTTPIDVQFRLQMTSLELNAQLLPSLKTKYKLTKTAASGSVGFITHFNAEILEHQVCFHVSKAHNGEASAPVIDTFVLPLPFLRASGRFRTEPTSSLAGPNPRLVYKAAGYYDVIVTAGPMEHTFSTDLLNQILFAEQSFRSELTFLLERLSVERPSSSLPASKPILFNLTFQGEGEPWLQLTASTPSSTAIRFTIDGPVFILTNRLMPLPEPKTQGTSDEQAADESSSSSEPERLFGRAKVQVNVKLGQLCKSAMYEEAIEEFQEYAMFMTQISAQNEEVSAGAFHNYIITLNRPILLVKATAIDKAILLWLNYRNTYNYWREEQQKLLMMANRYSNPSTTSTPSHAQSRQQQSGTDTHMNLSLNLAGSLYICMPIFSEDSDEENMSALLISLKKSDILVCVKKELACHAKFEAFKISFVDNFDEHSLSDEWLQEKTTSDSAHSNFVFFPEGSYYFCSSANPPTESNQNAKWVLSIQSEMKGMLIDFDNKIGKLTNLCAHTLSSFADESAGDDYEVAPSEASSIFISRGNYPPTFSVAAQNQDALSSDTAVSRSDLTIIHDKTGCFDEMNSLRGYESKIRWLERKMHEQSVKVTDLINEGKSEYDIEMARNKLRVYELARFKQFRQTMIEKLRPKMAQKTGAQLTPQNALQKQQSGFAQIREASSTSTTSNGQNSALKAATESVDLNIDVQIKIDTGQCILRAAPTNQSTSFYSAGAQRVLTKRLSTKDLKNKTNWPQSITKLQIPSLDAKLFYTSDSSAQLPLDISRTFIGQQRSKNKCFYLALELAKMLEQTLVTPALADFLEQVVEPLPESLFETTVQAPANANQSTNEDSVPIVALDTSTLPLDVFFHLTVYSSVIRFEGNDQRSTAAADCLLTLPSLTFMASTCKQSEQDLNAGIYMSATLSNFEISIYSPHQQATAHDALSVKLDKLLVTASRTKCPTTSEDDKNKVQLIIVSNVGKADFNYDMRRLSELLSFPKPWYRKKLIQRVFFGEQSIVRKGSISTTHSAPAFASNNLSIPSTRPISQSPQPTPTISTQRTEWAAEVDFSMQWGELNVKAQMSNVMGSTVWFVRQGIIRSQIKLDSFRQKTIAFGFKLDKSNLSAQGGAISGEIEMRRLLITAKHQKKMDKAPENMAKVELDSVEARVEWMSRPIFITLLSKPQISIHDKWDWHSNSSGKVDEACCMVNIDGSWSDLQMIITKNTTRDVTKIVQKLVSFFNDQIRNSRMVWGHYEFDRVSTSSDISTSTQHSSVEQNDADSLDSDTGRKKFFGKRKRTISTVTQHTAEHWQAILDLVTDVQMNKNILPLPTVKSGVTFVGGVVDFRAGRISLACMNGEMNATTWALFHMRQANILLTCKAKYAFSRRRKPVCWSSHRTQIRFPSWRTN